MNVKLEPSAICLYFLVLPSCLPRKEAPIEVQEPKSLTEYADLPSALYLVIEKDGKYFYYFGGEQTREPFELTALDTLVQRHKQTKDAVFITKPCGRPIHDNWEVLMEKLKTLGVERFKVDDSCL
jgi:hypothetical protein